MQNFMYSGCQGGAQCPFYIVNTNVFCELFFSHSSSKTRLKTWKMEGLGDHFGHQNRVHDHFWDTLNFNRFSKWFRHAVWRQNGCKSKNRGPRGSGWHSGVCLWKMQILQKSGVIPSRPAPPCGGAANLSGPQTPGPPLAAPGRDFIEFAAGVAQND